MNDTPKPDDDPKHPGENPPADPGIPPEMEELEAKGTPDTGRLESEVGSHKP